VPHRRAVHASPVVGGVSGSRDWAVSTALSADDCAAAFRSVDAVTVPVPDLDAGLGFYRDRLGHSLLWRNGEIGQAGLQLAASDTELVLTTRGVYAPSWLVSPLRTTRLLLSCMRVVAGSAAPRMSRWDAWPSSPMCSATN
jgi:hypothetical protein